MPIWTRGAINESNFLIHGKNRKINFRGWFWVVFSSPLPFSFWSPSSILAFVPHARTQKKVGQSRINSKLATWTLARKRTSFFFFYCELFSSIFFRHQIEIFVDRKWTFQKLLETDVFQVCSLIAGELFACSGCNTTKM